MVCGGPCILYSGEGAVSHLLIANQEQGDWLAQKIKSRRWIKRVRDSHSCAKVDWNGNKSRCCLLEAS